MKYVYILFIIINKRENNSRLSFNAEFRKFQSDLFAALFLAKLFFAIDWTNNSEKETK